MSGAAEIARMVAKCKRIPGLVKRTAPECARSLDAAINADLAAGRAPGGATWAPTKAGNAPLQNAAGNAALTRAVSTTLVTVPRVHYFHHNRGSRGMPVRAVIPRALTPGLAQAVKRPLVDAFNREVRRG
jgi:hypothetical protein